MGCEKGGDDTDGLLRVIAAMVQRIERSGNELPQGKMQKDCLQGPLVGRLQHPWPCRRSLEMAFVLAEELAGFGKKQEKEAEDPPR